MLTREKLLSNLNSLQQERSQIVSQGWCLQHCWLVQVKPGGKARTNRKYWQVRSRRTLFNGKKLKHLKPELIEDYQAAIERGRKLTQIERQIEKLKMQLQQFASTTQSLPTARIFPIPVANLAHSERSQPIDTFSDITKQEHLVKELLANSQALRASLQQSIARGKSIGRRYYT